MGNGFGKFVRRLRRGQTRKEVAERAGFTAEYLRQIEDEGQIPKEDKLISLARALDQDPREFLTRALIEKNQEAAHTILSVTPRFPRARAILAQRLEGAGVEVVKEDLSGLALAPQERAAQLLWAGILLMDYEGFEPAQAKELARERVQDKEFVEGVLAEYLARNLVTWQVDPDNGRQAFRVSNPRIEEFLDRMAEHLGQAPGFLGDESLETARKFAELLKEPEFTALYHHLTRFDELSEKDQAEIKAWWEVVNRMVAERLARGREKKGKGT